MIKWIMDNLGTTSCRQINDSVYVKNDKNDKNEKIYIIDTRDMVDKKGNSSYVIRQKIDDAIVHLDLGEKVVICCDYGMSRSNAIASGIISKYLHISFNDAVRKVMIMTKEKSIRTGVLSDVYDVIIDNSRNIIDNSRNIIDNSRNIIVTGSTGDIGTVIIPELKKYYNIYTPKREELDLTKDSIDLDIMVKEHNIDTIIHLANPRIHINQSMGESIVMLKNILDVCKENNVRLIYPSGWVVYSGYHDIIASESLLIFPRDHYSESKCLCEWLINHYRNRYNIKCINLRICPIYGTKDKPKFIYNFLENALENKDIITHRYINEFPYYEMLHVKDLISLFFEIIEIIGRDNSIDSTFNIGNGDIVYIKDIAKLIIKILDSKSNIIYQDINDYSPNIIMDSSLTRATFKWRPKINIEEGIKLLIDNYRSGR